MKMVQRETNKDSRKEAANFDVPIPKPPAELLDSFLSSLQSKLVTRRFQKNRNTAQQHDRRGAAVRN
jgi:hypothetical protein